MLLVLKYLMTVTLFLNMLILFFLSFVMVKSRTYHKDRTCVESHIYQGNKLVLHLVYYFGFGYGYPRYHFENFALYLSDLNYEIARFMKFVSKVISNPLSDVENIASVFDEDLTIF